MTKKDNKSTEKEYKVSWLKILIMVLLIFLVVFIIWLVYPKKQAKGNVDETYQKNMSSMKEAGFRYFNESNLPKEVGEYYSITLEQMLESGLINPFVDEEGETCNTTNSYIETTKINNEEYSMKVALTCKNKSDYIITSIYKESNEEQVDNQPNQNDNQNNNQSSTQSTTPATPTVNKYYNITYVDGCKENCLNNQYYTVTFDSNGGSLVPTQTVKKGAYATEIIPTKVGYKFLGWYLNNSKYDFATPVTQAITLFAKWEKVEEKVNYYTVTFYNENGSFHSNQTIKESDYANYPSVAKKECYDFIGWYTIDGEKFDFNTRIYKDINLYARYSYDTSCNTIKHEVTFVYNNGNANNYKTVNDGSRVNEPINPKKDGYTFNGWYYFDRYNNYVEYDFNSRVYQDITLYAEWIKEVETYQKYCKVASKTYYSIAYASKESVPLTTNWKIKFDNINAKDLVITRSDYLMTSADYRTAANYANNKGISMVNGNSKYEVPVYSGTMLETYSLKYINFNEYISTAYQENGAWYANITAYVYNDNYATPYYASNINSNIYFIPYQFDVEYTDLNDCVIDYASKQSYYPNYRIVDTYYY